MDPKPRDQRLPVAAATPSLTAAMRRARTEAAEQSDVVAELRGAEIARLEMLAEAVRPVLDQVPDSVDLFDTGLVPGDRPRYFVDMIAFVEMQRDRRTYHFFQDTRHGRVTLAESDKIDVMVDRITDYIARRLVEREQSMASDLTVEKAARAFSERPAQKQPVPPAIAPATPARRSFFLTALLFVVELIGSVVLFATIAAVGWFGWNAFWHWWALQGG